MKEENNKSQFYSQSVSQTLISTHRIFYSNISQRHFKLTMSQTEFLLFSTPQIIPPGQNYSSCKLLPTPQTLVPFDSFLSRIYYTHIYTILHTLVSKSYWFYCLNTTFRIHSNLTTSTRAISHQDYCTTMIECQNTTKIILAKYMSDYVPLLRVISGFPTSIPHFVSPIPDTLGPQGVCLAFPLPAMTSPLVSHTVLLVLKGDLFQDPTDTKICGCSRPLYKMA